MKIKPLFGISLPQSGPEYATKPSMYLLKGHCPSSPFVDHMHHIHCICENPIQISPAHNRWNHRQSCQSIPDIIRKYTVCNRGICYQKKKLERDWKLQAFVVLQNVSTGNVKLVSQSNSFMQSEARVTIPHLSRSCRGTCR